MIVYPATGAVVADYFYDVTILEILAVYEPRPLKIKNFGKDLSFGSVEELKDALVNEFKGKDTSVVFRTKPNGMLATVFVSVSEDGVIRESYGEESVVDFDAISERLLVV